MRDVLVGGVLGALAAFWAHGRVWPQPPRRTDAAPQRRRGVGSTTTTQRGEEEPAFVLGSLLNTSLAAPCAPTQSCAWMAAAPVRRRLVAPAAGWRRAEATWRDAFSAVSMAAAVRDSACARSAEPGASKTAAGPCAFKAGGSRRVVSTCATAPGGSFVARVRHVVRESTYAWATVWDAERARIVAADTAAAARRFPGAWDALVVAYVSASGPVPAELCAVPGLSAKTAVTDDTRRQADDDGDSAFVASLLRTGADGQGASWPFRRARGTGGRDAAAKPTGTAHGSTIARGHLAAFVARSALPAARRVAAHAATLAVLADLVDAGVLRGVLVSDAAVFFVASPTVLLGDACVREGFVFSSRSGRDERDAASDAAHRDRPAFAQTPPSPTAALVAYCGGSSSSGVAARAAQKARARTDALEKDVATNASWISLAAAASDLDATLLADHTDDIAVFDAMVVVSREQPAVFATTRAVHVRGGDDDLLGSTPVARGSRGGGSATLPFASVATIAAELGLLGGADCYYCLGGPHRYVALEDATLATLPPDFHAGDKILLVAVNLLALAYFTGRTPVLPSALHFEKYFHAWELLDLDTVGALLSGTNSTTTPDVVRPSTFLRHPRLRRWSADAPTAARLVLRGDGAVGVRDDAAERWYEADVDGDDALRKRLLWAVAARDRIAEGADVLYVDLDASLSNALVFPDKRCVARFAFGGHDDRACGSSMRVEPWLAGVHDRLAACTHDTHNLRALNMVAAIDDCHAKRREDARYARLALLGGGPLPGASS